jgi:hypothetical protein
VDLVVVPDDSQQTDKYSSATFLRNGGVAVLVDGEHRHRPQQGDPDDSDTVITGSFNFVYGHGGAEREELPRLNSYGS